jgi:hypothetical protein
MGLGHHLFGSIMQYEEEFYRNALDANAGRSLADYMYEYFRANVDGFEVLRFDTTTNRANDEGEIGWNELDGTLEIIMKGGNVVQQVGLEQYIFAKSASNSGIADGKVYYFAGSDGSNKLVELARADTAGTSDTVIGIGTETTVGGAKGYVTTFGFVRGLPDSAVADCIEGSVIYLSATVPGGLTSTAPISPYHEVRVGYCTRKQPNNNEIFVGIQVGPHLPDLHDVLITSPTNGQALIYDSATALWKNQAAVQGPVTWGQLAGV